MLKYIRHAVIMLLISAYVSPASLAQAPASTSEAPAQSGFKIGQTFADYIRPIVGANFVFRSGNDYADFKVENDVLLTQNDSRLRVGALAGFFTPVSRCGVWWHKIEMARGEGKSEADIETLFNEEAKSCRDEYGSLNKFRKFFLRSGIIYTLQFTQGSQDTLDGFTFGWGFSVKPGVLLTAGYTNSKGTELSSGFRRAAAATVADPAQTQHAHFRGLLNASKTDLTSIESWDGLPLKRLDGTNIFPGNPIVESYNSSLSFGVAISLDAILK